MKARISNPFCSGISAVLSVLTLGCFAASSTQAASIYWDGTSASWNTNTNWSTASGADTPDPVAVPGAADDAIFNISTVNDPETITLDANQAVNSMTFNNTGTTALTGGGTARTLSLGTGGITVASGAGAVTLGDGTAGNNVLLNLSGAQTWINNTANAFTINNDAATFTRQTGATLTFNKASTGDFAISTTVAPLVNTIIGPWAFFGTGANQKYAVSGATVTGKIGTTTTSMSHTGATTNYELSGTALTLGGGAYSSNTIRYAGTGASYNFTNSVSGGSSYTTNGILAVGASGTLTLRNSNTADDSSLIVGSTGELVIAGRQAVTINVPIAEGAAGRRLIYSGSNTLILGVANTYTGSTTVSSGTLRLNNSLALQNSPLNTSGSIAGNSTNGLRTTLTALTLGGLTGNKDLASRLHHHIWWLQQRDRPDPQPGLEREQLFRCHRERRRQHESHQDRRRQSNPVRRKHLHRHHDHQRGHAHPRQCHRSRHHSGCGRHEFHLDGGRHHPSLELHHRGRGKCEFVRLCPHHPDGHR